VWESNENLMGTHHKFCGKILKTTKSPKIDSLSPTTKEFFLFLLGACYITTFVEQFY
jgi:hypothetical protein